LFKIKEQTKNIQPQQKNKSQIFSVSSEQKSSKCRTISKAHLLHAYSRTTASFQLRENKQKLHAAF